MYFFYRVVPDRFLRKLFFLESCPRLIHFTLLPRKKSCSGTNSSKQESMGAILSKGVKNRQKMANNARNNARNGVQSYKNMRNFAQF